MIGAAVGSGLSLGVTGLSEGSAVGVIVGDTVGDSTIVSKQFPQVSRQVYHASFAGVHISSCTFRRKDSHKQSLFILLKKNAPLGSSSQLSKHLPQVSSQIS